MHRYTSMMVGTDQSLTFMCGRCYCMLTVIVHMYILYMCIYTFRHTCQSKHVDTQSQDLVKARKAYAGLLAEIRAKAEQVVRRFVRHVNPCAHTAACLCLHDWVINVRECVKVVHTTECKEKSCRDIVRFFGSFSSPGRFVRENMCRPWALWVSYRGVRIEECAKKLGALIMHAHSLGSRTLSLHTLVTRHTLSSDMSHALF